MHSTKQSIVIDAPKERIWEALTKPEEVKQYFFGTNLDTTWEPGSPIYFRGEWEGKSYEDKGTVLTWKPLESFSYDYWSPFSGEEDAPENYQTIMFTLEDDSEGTKVSIDQSNVSTQEKADHSGENWKKVLQALKEHIEKA